MNLASKYLDYIGGVRRYSTRTLAIYSDVLQRFSDFVMGQEASILEDASLVSATAIRNYEVSMLDGGKEGSRTVNLHLSVLSSFCHFLMKEGLLSSNPAKSVPRPKMEKRLPDFYRKEAMDAYFDSTAPFASEENLSLIGGQDRKLAADMYLRRLRRLVIILLYDTAIRRSELLSLKVASVDFGRNVIKVRGKGDKMREIPLIVSLSKEISLYLKSRELMVGDAAPADAPLLVTERGKALYPVWVDRCVKRELGHAEGITGRRSPHVLRHTLATELLDDGADLNSIKELLGHSSLAATQVYTHNTIEKLRKVYNNAHPRAKNGGKDGD